MRELDIVSHIGHQPRAIIVLLPTIPIVLNLQCELAISPPDTHLQSSRQRQSD